jgi:hypothetical protein
MTKAELIEAMKNYPDNDQIEVWCWFDCRDPAGAYNITDIRRDEARGSIIFSMDDDIGA